MSYTITSECIVCDRCRVECPTNAISFNNGVLLIDSATCNHCLGYYGTPQCAAVCPTNAGCLPSDHYGVVVPDKPQTDYWDTWFNRYHTLVKRLKTEPNQLYWEHWFDVYSKKIAFLLSQETVKI